MTEAELARIPFFEGLDAGAIATVRQHMRPRRFAAGAWLCREGEAGDSLYVIESGLTQAFVARPEGLQPLSRMRRGDVLGEVSLLTGEPRSATVIAIVPTEALELTREGFAAVLPRYPAILANVGRILSRRLVERTQQQFTAGSRGEAIALVLDRDALPLAADVLAAARAATPRAVAALDLAGVLPEQERGLDEPTVVNALARLDRLLADHAAVIVLAGSDTAELTTLLQNVDRVVVLGNVAEARRVTDMAGPGGAAVEAIQLHGSTRDGSTDDAGSSVIHDTAAGGVLGAVKLRVVRTVDPDDREALIGHVAWLGRHLTRTKLGLALGAGGGKGYAHIGVLHVLHDAGYTVDYVSGSSIGAMVGSWLALGRNAREVEATMREAWTPENVATTFKLSFAGTSTGLEVKIRLCRETTDERTFADLRIPLTVMTVDLNTRMPAPITDGPIWQALVAATALPGLFPPYQRGEQRLVDGLALVPVPTGAVIDSGADVTVAVNIMSRETLLAWPGEEPPPPPPIRGGARMLDTLMEVMDLAQLDSSVRHAALANVPITPRFGPASWRDFHLAEKFLDAGREAAEERLPALRKLANPQVPRGDAAGVKGR